MPARSIVSVCCSPHLCVGFLFLILYPASTSASSFSSAAPALCHTPSFTTQLCTPVSHTTSSHAIFHHTIFHTQLCHNFAHTQLCHTPSFTSLCLAGVALGDIHHHFVWQAWHLVTSTFVSRSRCGTYGTGLALVAQLCHNFARAHTHTTLSHTIFHTTLRGRHGAC